MIFYRCYQNPLGQLLKQFSKLYKLWGPATWPSWERWYTRNPQFSRFFENISVSFWYFFLKYFLVARSYLVVEINIKILIIGSMVNLERRLKVPIFAVFWRFWASLNKLFVMVQAFSLGRKISSMYILSLVVRDFFMIPSSEPIINTMHIRFS